ncbi:hypothetical protein LOZ66_006524 [Ophidiomyces ophidiicola]|nr:hypothetical protein LOZ66_006524 [Ophidiomyces ophidiicola]
MTAPIQPIKRSFTLPSKPRRVRHSLGSYDRPSISIPSDDIIFYHPSATIVKFELPRSSSSSPILPDLDYPVDAIETLPWRTRSEVIAAIGALRIENVAGSAAFLKSGNVVYALLKNCQCWCVDAKATFVLRVRKLTYYRIEFPYETEEDLLRIEEWKQILSNIIRYEVTPCPFKRGFSVELPEEARTPKKKRAWRPKTILGIPNIPQNFEGSISSEDRESSESGSIADDFDSRSIRCGSVPPPTNRRFSHSSAFSMPRRTSFRVVSEPAPNFETLLAKFESESEKDKSTLAESASVASSASSFYSAVDPPPSFRSYSPSPLNRLPMSHTRETSVATIIPVPADDSSLDHSSPTNDDQAPSSPASIPVDFDCSHSNIQPVLEVSVESQNTTIRQRIRARQRSLSPLPPSSTLFTPAPKSPINNLFDTIFEKTYTFVLGPPIHLLVMFLRLAAEVSSGDNPRHPAETGAGRSFAESHMLDETEDIWSEDDFGNPLSSIGSTRQMRGESPADSDLDSEVD